MRARGVLPWSRKSVSLVAAASQERLCRKRQASFESTGSSLFGAVIVAGPSSGTEMVTWSDFVARRVCVQRDPVRDLSWSRHRSGVLDRKLEMRAGVGSAWVAKRTDWRSSRLAMAVTTGSEEESILVAWTMVWRWFSTQGSVSPRPPARLDAKK